MLAQLLQPYVLLIVLVFFLIQFKLTSNLACSVSINEDLVDKHPLLIDTRHGEPRFALPTSYDRIIIQTYNEMELFCPGSFILIDNKSLRVNWTTVFCNHSRFILNEKIVEFPSISCSKSPKDVARYTGKHCLRDDYKEFQIGYIYKNYFLELITGCFDKRKQNTLYTVYTLSKIISGKKVGHPRKKFWTQGSFYSGVSVNNAYKRNNQRISINNQLGLDPNSKKYITEKDQKYYLSRGHLAPKADFMYGPHQDATFYFINAIPQWSLLNSGNWNILEKNLRTLASGRRIDLKIYTGTAEILSLPHDCENRSVELFLYARKKRKSLPIPKFIWKVAYDEVSGSGVAFVGVNNPFLKENFDEYTICTNICDKLNYIHKKFNYVRGGYIYCCEISDLIGKVSTIPIRNVTKLLT